MMDWLIGIVHRGSSRSGPSRLAAAPPAIGAARHAVSDPNHLDRFVWDVLRRHESIALDALVDQVAEEALASELSRGGWASDIALWGPSCYRRAAKATIVRMLGHSLVLDAEGSGVVVRACPEAMAPFVPSTNVEGSQEYTRR